MWKIQVVLLFGWMLAGCAIGDVAAPGPAVPANLRHVVLKYLEAKRAAEILVRMEGVDAVAAPTNNEVVFWGDLGRVKEAEDLLMELDKDVMYESVVGIYPLKHANAAEVYAVLRAAAGAGDLENGIVAAVDVRTNSIICRAGGNFLERARKLIEQLDR